MKQFLTYSQRIEMITTNVWEEWTKNGLNLDDDARVETLRAVRDAANDAYAFDVTDGEWYTRTMQRLKRRGKRKCSYPYCEYEHGVKVKRCDHECM